MTTNKKKGGNIFYQMWKNVRTKHNPTIQSTALSPPLNLQIVLFLQKRT